MMTNPDGKKLIFVVGLTRNEVGLLAVGFVGEGILFYRGMLPEAVAGAVLMLIGLVNVIRLNHRKSR